MEKHNKIAHPMGSTTAQANNNLDTIRQLAAQGEAISHAAKQIAREVKS